MGLAVMSSKHGTTQVLSYPSYVSRVATLKHPYAMIGERSVTVTVV